MNYQIYLGTAGPNAQCLPHILYHRPGEQSNITRQIFSNLNIQNSKKKKTYLMVVLIFDILSREAAAGY